MAASKKTFFMILSLGSCKDTNYSAYYRAFPAIAWYSREYAKWVARFWATHFSYCSNYQQVTGNGKKQAHQVLPEW